MQSKFLILLLLALIGISSTISSALAAGKITWWYPGKGGQQMQVEVVGEMEFFALPRTDELVMVTVGTPHPMQWANECTLRVTRIRILDAGHWAGPGIQIVDAFSAVLKVDENGALNANPEGLEFNSKAPGIVLRCTPNGLLFASRYKAFSMPIGHAALMIQR